MRILKLVVDTNHIVSQIECDDKHKRILCMYECERAFVFGGRHESHCIMYMRSYKNVYRMHTYDAFKSANKCNNHNN